MTLLIVQTGSALPEVRRRHGDFAAWFMRGMGRDAGAVRVVRVDRGATLPPPRDVRAAIITGSGAMVTEREAWSEATAAWLRHAVAADLPVLGVCYGHQLLAHALGGKVGYNPRGREMGSVRIIREPRHADPLLDGMPPEFDAQATHRQSVLRPPRGARVLARSNGDDCQAVRYAPRAWGFQFHPEFAAVHMRGYIRARREALQQEAFDVAALLRNVRATPLARGLLRRFARLATAHA